MLKSLPHHSGVNLIPKFHFFNFYFLKKPSEGYRVKKSSEISCSKGRAYSSSFPVWYIPKISSEHKELQDFSTINSSEDREKQNNSDSNTSRVEFLEGGKSSWRSLLLVYKYHHRNRHQSAVKKLISDVTSEVKGEIDTGFGAGDYDFLEEPEEIAQELEINLGNSPRGWIDVGTGKTKQEVERLAIELLATRGYTVVELKKKLHGKRLPFDMVNAVITDFRRRGLINDGLYAEAFSRSRWSSSTWGPRRIKQALAKKGVNEADADNAIKLVFKDNEAGTDGESGLGLSKLSLDHLLVQATKQWLRGQNVTRETRISRIIRWLQYRGFNWGIINFVLKRLESEYPL